MSRAFRVIVSAAAASVAIALFVSPALARKSPPRIGGGASAYDGRWIIDATAGGLCPVRSKQLTADVRGGRLLRLGGLPSTTASGGVSPSGDLSIRMRTLGTDVHVHGHLQGPSAGAGDWSADSVICSGGSWSAHAAR